MCGVEQSHRWRKRYGIATSRTGKRGVPGTNGETLFLLCLGACDSCGMNLQESYDAALREMDDLRRFVGRVQRMLDREEVERLKDWESLNPQQAKISDIFADASPQVFYTSVVMTLIAILERHLTVVIEECKFPELCASDDPRSIKPERWQLRWTTMGRQLGKSEASLLASRLAAFV